MQRLEVHRHEGLRVALCLDRDNLQTVRNHLDHIRSHNNGLDAHVLFGYHSKLYLVLELWRTALVAAEELAGRGNNSKSERYLSKWHAKEEVLVILRTTYSGVCAVSDCNERNRCCLWWMQ